MYLSETGYYTKNMFGGRIYQNKKRTNKKI